MTGWGGREVYEYNGEGQRIRKRSYLDTIWKEDKSYFMRMVRCCIRCRMRLCSMYMEAAAM